LHGLEGDALEEAKEQCHQRGADRLLQLCMKNGGIYIKLGQHIAMLDYLLPEAYVYTMRAHLLDRCPVSSWESVRKTITEDFGAPPEILFTEMEQTPIASASLAQVHLARDALTGRKVAVKVQHRGLRETSDVDIATIEFVVKAVKRFAGVDYLWLVEEVQENLPTELDFLIEAANSERCAVNLSSKAASRQIRGTVAVPVIDHSKTSHRIITMEYIDGVKVTDIDGLKKIGAPPAAVARLISQTFNEMIFKFGDIHADPHSANLLVRKTPPGSNTKQKWQLVLLDHGLYRVLDDDFRLQYASLWRSLIFGDVAGIERSATAMNAGDAVPLFAGMLTRRPWREVSKSRSGADRLKLTGTAEEKEEIMEYSIKYAGAIGELLARIPRELLLLLKTNDNLRAVDAELGAGVSTYLITARECTKALAEHRAAQVPWWRSFAASWVETVKLESLLLGLKTMAVVEPLRAALWGHGDNSRDEEEEEGLAI
jgi:aarF domain-containing kinase